MSGLTLEQLEKIEKNRRMAILKKTKALSSFNTNNDFNFTPLISHHTNENTLTSKVIGDLTDDKVNSTLTLQKYCPNYQISKPKNFATSVSNSVNSSLPVSPISASCRLLSDDTFTVDMPFHSPSIEIFKSIPGRLYDPALKIWKFPLKSYEIVVNKLQKLATINGIPDTVLHSLRSPDASTIINEVDLTKIDKSLLDTILPFQEEGIRFGISKKGRCLIADDMGLGKTIQALGIAHYFVENWPLLIMCPSAMKYPWEEAIQNYLPSINPFYITVMTTSKDLINEAKVVICSYDLVKLCIADLLMKNFGFIIIDESHSLKSLKANRTKAALQLTARSKHVVLLSGTPALSRPVELYPQITAIDPLSFHSFFEFGIRYCDGKKNKFGWNFSGSSNMKELELFLKRKLMIRRVKSEIITQLPSKIRKVIVLNPSMVKSVTRRMEKLAVDLENTKGVDKKATLLSYYALTGDAKKNSVCDYIRHKLEGDTKFLIFAHHSNMVQALCEMLTDRNIQYIKIDGATNPELRKSYCDMFQNNKNCRVAVLSIRAANAGITLTAAQLVIFAELYWNPGELIQAEDRAHRIGQSDSVVVEYLIAKGTADDHIWNLIQHKLNVLNKAGLSKDTLSELHTKRLEPKKQLTLDVIYKTKTSDIHRSAFSDETIADSNDDGDDELFANIQLDNIENQFHFKSNDDNK